MTQKYVKLSDLLFYYADNIKSKTKIFYDQRDLLGSILFTNETHTLQLF